MTTEHPPGVITIDSSSADHVLYIGPDAVATVWLGHTHMAPVFAAAPELLEAAKAVVLWARRQKTVPIPPKKWIPLLDAIAKAEGMDRLIEKNTKAREEQNKRIAKEQAP